MNKTTRQPKNKIIREIYQYIILIVSMSGFVPKNATAFRKILIGLSVVFIYYITAFQQNNSKGAIIYFILSEIIYFGFITTVLSENGLRHWFIQKFGDETRAYTAYETILGFIFLQNGASIGYIASSTPGDLFSFLPGKLLIVIVSILFAAGLIIKILAAKAVTIDIYYWKDMFLGRKITDFVVSGPYKYFSNPMYGIGQLQAYAVAIWYGSAYGLMAAFVNQLLIFTFFYFFEKKFIKRVYQSGNL